MLQIIRRAVPIRQDIAYYLCFTVAETEILKIKDDINTKSLTILDHHGPTHIENVCHFSGPPSFSLQTTFKVLASENMQLL